MALTTQQENFITELQQAAAEQLALRNWLANLSARWVQNDFFNTMDEADVAAATHGVSKGEVIEGINAINAVLTALGDNSTGQAVNLIKLKV